MVGAGSKSIDKTRWLGRIDLQQDDLLNAPEPNLAIHTVNGYDVTILEGTQPLVIVPRVV